MDILDRFDRSAQITDFPGRQGSSLDFVGRLDADLRHFIFAFTLHEADMVADFDLSFLDTDENDDTAVGIVVGIKDQGLQGILIIAFGRRQIFHDTLQDIFHIQSCLCRDTRCIGTVQTDDVFDLFLCPLDIGTGQIDLVDDRQDLQIIVQSQVGICQSLGFDALRCIYHENCSVTGCQGSGHLIGKVDMARCIDQMEDIFLTVFGLVGKLNDVQFDRDASLSFQIQGIQDLILHLSFGYGIGQFQNAVRQSGLAVVDMSDDGKIPDILLIQVFHLPYFCRLRCRKPSHPSNSFLRV